MYRGCTFSVVIALLLFWPALVGVATAQDTSDELQAEIVKLTSQVRQLSAQVIFLKAENKELREQLAAQQAGATTQPHSPLTTQNAEYHAPAQKPNLRNAATNALSKWPATALPDDRRHGWDTFAINKASEWLRANVIGVETEESIIIESIVGVQQFTDMSPPNDWRVMLVAKANRAPVSGTILFLRFIGGDDSASFVRSGGELVEASYAGMIGVRCDAETAKKLSRLKPGATLRLKGRASRAELHPDSQNVNVATLELRLDELTLVSP